MTERSAVSRAAVVGLTENKLVAPRSITVEDGVVEATCICGQTHFIGEDEAEILQGIIRCPCTRSLKVRSSSFRVRIHPHVDSAHSIMLLLCPNPPPFVPADSIQSDDRSRAHRGTDQREHLPTRVAALYRVFLFAH